MGVALRRRGVVVVEVGLGGRGVPVEVGLGSWRRLVVVVVVVVVAVVLLGDHGGGDGDASR